MADKDDELFIKAVRKHTLIYRPRRCTKCVWRQPKILPKSLSVHQLMVIAICISEGGGFKNPILSTSLAMFSLDLSDGNTCNTELLISHRHCRNSLPLLFSANQCNWRIRCVTTMRFTNLHFT